MSGKKVWFITGAGRGMGADFATAAAGDAVVATSRNPDATRSISSTKAFESLDLVGWERASKVLPTVVRQLVVARGGEEVNPTHADAKKNYASTEKIYYLARKSSTESAPAGYNPDAGDLTYYAPWGTWRSFTRTWLLRRAARPPFDTASSVTYHYQS